MWQVWLILAGIFIIFEMIVPTDFLIFWVGIGAAIAALCSLFTDNITIQIAVFCISSVLLLFCTKPFVKRAFKNSVDLHTNAKSIIGKTGIVTTEIDSLAGKGQIKVENEVWSAKTMSQEKIPKGTLIQIQSIDGVKAVVTTKDR